jgi:hypothetical protein
MFSTILKNSWIYYQMNNFWAKEVVGFLRFCYHSKKTKPFDLIIYRVKVDFGNGMP